MGTKTGIEWCDHTFNPWTGCQAVSPACDHCYAETLDKRFGHADRWGPHGIRVRTGIASWHEPVKWNRRAASDGVRRRVFCASMGDVFDNHVPPSWRDDLWGLIHETPALDWLLLTKRPQNIESMLPTELHGTPTWGQGWHNVWLGVTVENQIEACRRIPILLGVPAKRRFLSCEPLLGPLNITWALSSNPIEIGAGILRSGRFSPGLETLRPIDWVICGGESGHDARPTIPSWARSLREQCENAGVPFFFKQWGEWRPVGPIYHQDDEFCEAIASADEKRSVIFTRNGSEHFDWEGQPPEGSWMMERVGKKKSGALLDGVEHRAFPAPTP